MDAPKSHSHNDLSPKLEQASEKTLPVAMTSGSAFRRSPVNLGLEDKRALWGNFLKPTLPFEHLLCTSYYMMVYCN